MDREIVDVVRSRYGSVAKSDLSSRHEGVRTVAEAFGYSPEQLASIPAEANMGLSCGNPTAFAGLNLLQSAFTNWCPMVWLLARIGMKPCAARPGP